jgi:hypothetical protein
VARDSFLGPNNLAFQPKVFIGRMCWNKRALSRGLARARSSADRLSASVCMNRETNVFFIRLNYFPLCIQ